MNKLFILTLSLFVFYQAANAQQQFTLDEIIERAKEQSPSAKQAETRKENRYWQYKLFRSNFNPQLVLGGNLPGVEIGVRQQFQDDGRFRPISFRNTNTSIGMSLNQAIPLTGGQVSLVSSLNATTSLDPVEEDIDPGWANQFYGITLTQPLFGFNDLKWSKKIEPLRFEESKKSFVEEMELVSRTAVELYFDYLDAQVNLQVAQFNLANNDTIYNIEQGRYQIGTTSKDKLLQVELGLLRSQQGVASANLALQSSSLRMNSFIGLNDSDFDLELPVNTPEFSVNIDEALEYARRNRADFVQFERRRLEAQRDVADAKANRFSVNLLASIGQSGFGGTFNRTLENQNEQQSVDITFQIPILNWGRNEASLKTALANQQLTEFTIKQDELNFDQEVITLVARMGVLRSQLEIARKSDEVAQERYLVAQNRYLIGKIDITNLNIALEEKDTAKRSYVQALRDFWTAYYDLRRLTLYDFVNNQLLYKE